MRTVSFLSAASIAVLVALAPAQAQQPGEPINPSLTPAPTGEGGPASAYAWAGGWFSNHYAGGYAGIMKALNDSDDLWSDGFSFRVDGSGGSYTYDSMGFNNINVDTYDVDAMIGYRAKVNKGMFSIYVGPTYQSHDNPDPAADIRGSEFGAKVLADISGPLADNLDGYAQGSFSTAFSTYSLTGRLLWHVSDTVWLGPQATLFGNNAPYSESTFGPYLKFNTNFGEIGVAAGYRHAYTSGHSDGYFATIYLGLPIQ